MNNDIFEGKWKQIRGEAKAWWGKLTDNDLDRAAGKFDVLVGVLQEKYGYTREQAADEVDKRVSDYEAKLKKADPVRKKPDYSRSRGVFLTPVDHSLNHSKGEFLCCGRSS